MRLKDLFDAAQACAPEERAAFLDRACGGDRALRAQLEELLRADSGAERFLEEPAALAVQGLTFGITDAIEGNERSGEGLAAGEAVQLAGRQLGRYRIRERIATGGMGVVYLAEQDTPHRAVALKIIRAEFASPAMLRRFEREAELLGRLQHPGIAQIFEAGTADAGKGPQPYLAMELVHGKPLLDHARHRGLGTRQRVDLMVKVCEAVAHAHRKGIIHRDLKPGNILVDESGQPKVLDFGIARATDSDIRVTTLRTDMGQILGTIPYMSPEQMAGDPDDLDTRSDVYALGVVLYELLAGRLPYDVEKKPVPEAVRVIASEEPTPLSSLDRIFRSDLDTIVTKALEKDRTRRYQSASDLADDLSRYLRDEPIAARPPSVAYQMRKLVRRHRLPFAVAAAAFVLLSASAIFAAVQAARTAREQDRAVKVAAHLQEMLAAFTPARAGGVSMDLRQALDDAAQRVESELSEEPEIAAALRETIGNGYRGLGLYAEAEPHLRYALTTRRLTDGEGTLPFARTSRSLARLLQAKGDYAAAEPLLREALAIARERLGDAHEETADTMSELALLLRARGQYPAAEPLLRDALAIRRRLLGNQHPDVGSAMANLASLLVIRGENATAEALYGEARATSQSDLAIRVAARAVDRSLTAYPARVGRVSDQYAAAEPLYREALAIERLQHGGPHPEVASALHALATVLAARQDYASAEPLFREALAMRRTLLGDAHPEVADTLNDLGALLCSFGTIEGNTEGEALLAEALDMRRRLLGNLHPDVAASLIRLASRKLSAGDRAAAAALEREALSIQRQTLGNEHPDVAVTLRLLAATLGWEKGVPLLREALEVRRQAFGSEHPIVAGTLYDLGIWLYNVGEHDAAEPVVRESLAQRRKLLGEGLELADSLQLLAQVLYEKAAYDEAEDAIRETIAIRRSLPVDTYDWRPYDAAIIRERQISHALLILGRIITDKGEPARAEPLFREGVDLGARTLKGTPWFDMYTYNLGICLMELRRFDEAEPHLVRAVPAARQLYGDAHWTTHETIVRIVDLYERWGQPEKAAPYRGLLESPRRSISSPR